MSEFTVHMIGHISGGIRVTADDLDSAIETAMTWSLPPLCAPCRGWRGRWLKEEGEGRRRWFKEESDEWTKILVTDTDGKKVWTGPGPSEQRVTDELANVAELIKVAPDITQAAALIRNRIGQIRSAR